MDILPVSMWIMVNNSNWSNVVNLRDQTITGVGKFFSTNQTGREKLGDTSNKLNLKIDYIQSVATVDHSPRGNW